MSNATAKKVFIKVESAEEQQENIKNSRKTLKVLQSGVTDKENLAGRPCIDKLSTLKAAIDPTLAASDYTKRKRIDGRSIQTQTSPEKRTSSSITVEDLTSTENPGEHYWQTLAEKRRDALERSLTENQRLHERIEGLEEELNTSRQMLEEARSLVEVLTEMLNENEAEKEINLGNDEDNCNRNDNDDQQSVTEPEDDEASRHEQLQKTQN